MMREMSRGEALERIEFRVRYACPEANGSNIGECSGCWRYPCNEMKAVGLLAQERLHGEWKLRSPYEAWFEEYKCSNCNAYGWFNWHFCPNCGADMRKEGEHNEQTTD